MKIYINCLHYRTTERVGTLVWLSNVIAVLSEYCEVVVLQRQEVGMLFKFVNTVKIKVRFPVLSITRFTYSHLGAGDVILTPHLGGPLLPNYKTVMVIHDLAWNDIKDKYHFIRRNKLILSTWLFNHLSKHVWTVSEFSRSRIADLYHREAPVVTNLVSVESRRGTCYVPKYDKFFLSIGTVQPGKNYTRLQGIMDRDFPDELLIVLGRNEAGLKDSNNVKFIGYVSDDEMLGYLDNASGFINVSYYEGFGIPVIDAMYHGLPILISIGSAFDHFRNTSIVRCDPYDDSSISKGILDLIELNGKRINYDIDLTHYSLENLHKQVKNAISKI